MWFRCTTISLFHITTFHKMIMQVVSPLYHITITRSLWHSDALWRHRSGSTLVQVMACCLTVPIKPWLPEPIPTRNYWHPSQCNFTDHTLDFYASIRGRYVNNTLRRFIYSQIKYFHDIRHQFHEFQQSLMNVSHNHENIRHPSFSITTIPINSLCPSDSYMR